MSDFSASFPICSVFRIKEGSLISFRYVIFLKMSPFYISENPHVSLCEVQNEALIKKIYETHHKMKTIPFR